ncbi:MAG: GDP-mannose 4,6-dehydratase [Solirubrobacteraceae bacterium]
MVEPAGARVIVTGGAGFIGSHLVDALLHAGAEHVVVVDTLFLGSEANLEAARRSHGERVRFYREDAGDLVAMQSICAVERPDIVFNLATKTLLYSFFNPPGAFSVNTDIAAALGELLRAGAFRRLVQVSSSEVYGSAREPRMSENHPFGAETSYAAGKAAADLLLMSYMRMFDADITIIRPFNNYGPRQNPGEFAGLIPGTLTRLASGRAPLVQGGGDQTRDFIFVSDTVRALMRLGFHAGTRGRTFNVGSGREVSVSEVVAVLSELLGYEGTVERTPRRTADVDRHCADVADAETLIGPLATVDLREGLRQTIAWHDQWAGKQ